MLISVILPAAGSGRRFRGEGRDATASASKIEYLLEGKPVFLHAVDALRGLPEVFEVLMAVHPERLGEFEMRWGAALSDRGVRLVAGGLAERWETVKLALDRVDPRASHVAVHDAARPIVPQAVLERLVRAGRRWPAVIPVLPISSTVKRVGPLPPEWSGDRQGMGDAEAGQDAADRILSAIGPDEGDGSSNDERRLVIETVPRANLVAVQTPQLFEVSLLRRAYAEALDDPPGMAGVTDDASLIERLGEAVVTVEGHGSNLKITRPEDAELLANLLKQRTESAARKRAVAELFGDDED